MNMQATDNLLRTISAETLFQCLFQTYPDCYSQARTWTHAAKVSNSRKWQALQVAVINQYRLVTFGDSSRLGKSCQPLVDAVNVRIEPIARLAWAFFSAKAGVHAAHFHTEFIVHLRWACVELECIEHLQVTFFSRLLIPFYQSGHIPCGIGRRDAEIDYAHSFTISKNDLIII